MHVVHAAFIQNLLLGIQWIFPGAFTSKMTLSSSSFADDAISEIHAATNSRSSASQSTRVESFAIKDMRSNNTAVCKKSILPPKALFVYTVL